MDIEESMENVRDVSSLNVVRDGSLLNDVRDGSSLNVVRGSSSNVIKNRTVNITDELNNRRALHVFFSDEGREENIESADEREKPCSSAKKITSKKFGSKIDSKTKKEKNVPWSFKKNKSAKEITLEKKHQFEKEKLERKAEARLELARFIEGNKSKRHEERCSLMKEILDKM